MINKEIFKLEKSQEDFTKMFYDGKVIKCLVAPYHTAEYFEKNRYKPKYDIGDRVFGYYKKVPFMGSVGNDRCIDGVTPEITIHLDLPIRIDKCNFNVILVAHRDIKQRLKEF